ncbi:MAG TPA: chromosomal replication initiator protein DnaA [Bacteroidia bacterium]|nr:chromosomal replication initiator protein DnaA [Bacteroidia bacterium]
MAETASSSKKKAETVWKTCLSFIKENVSDQNYQTWFLPIKALEINDTKLLIQVPSMFFYEYIEEHYIDLIKKALELTIGKNAELNYLIEINNSSSKNGTIKLPNVSTNIKNPSVNVSTNAHQPKMNPFAIPGIKKIQIDSHLNPNYSFENFAEGECNRLARSAAYAVAEKLGQTAFNPLFIYGGVGLGKTHLAQAIGIEVKKRHPDKIVLYVQTDRFTTQYTEAVRENKQNDFVHFYQMVDVLIVDDIQFLAGKEKTQETFFHIFNHLHQLGKQLVITSDRAPIDLPDMMERLVSRFKWGLQADITPPDYETRKKILYKKIELEGMDIPEEVISYIAQSITTSVRELEGALISIMAHASINKREITVELAKEIVDKFARNINREITVDMIQKIVCEYFNLKPEELKAKTRRREIVQPRQIIMYFAKKYTKASLQAIGALCGGKDHSTVLHACRNIEDLKQTDKQIRNYIEDIDKKLNLSITTKPL